MPFLSTVLHHNYPLPPEAVQQGPRVIEAAPPTTSTGPKYKFTNNDVYSMLFNGVESWAKNIQLGKSALQAHANEIKLRKEGVNADVIEIPDNPRYVDVTMVAGMGPLAGIDMATKSFKSAEKDGQPTSDQDHMPSGLLNQSLLVMDRTAYLNSFTGDRNDLAAWYAHLTAKVPENPLWGMLDLTRRATNSGAHVEVMPCNTAHMYHVILSAESSVPFLNIADSVMYHLAKKYKDRTEPLNILIVATEGTVAGGLYPQQEREMRKKYALPPINWVTPGAKAQSLISSGIYDGVKASNLPLGAQLVHDGEVLAIHQAAAEGTTIHLRGQFCTEIEPAEAAMGPLQKSDLAGSDPIDAAQTLIDMAIDASKALKQANKIVDQLAQQQLDAQAQLRVAA